MAAGSISALRFVGLGGGEAFIFGRNSKDLGEALYFGGFMFLRHGFAKPICIPLRGTKTDAIEWLEKVETPFRK